MQSAMFIGNLAADPALQSADQLAYCRFTLIANEYAGKDAGSGGVRLRTVSVQFTAFQALAENFAKYARKGDQIIVGYHIENNNYEKDGAEIFTYNFVVERFQFGAPGKLKRKELSEEDELMGGSGT